MLYAHIIILSIYINANVLEGCAVIHPYRMNQYQLGICELYNTFLHGPCDPPAEGHFLFMFHISLSELHDGGYTDIMSAYPRPIRQYSGNVRAYWDIVRRPRMYPLLEIVQTVMLEPGGECVAIIKTFWIRLVQRRWKRIFAERRRRLAPLLKPYGLMKRECGLQ